MDMIQDAIYFAAKRHGDQKYGEGIPYLTHLACVMSILFKYKAPNHVIVAGILHDVLEDTETTFEELDALFGDKVSRLVLAVTNPKEGTRKEKHAIQYPKIVEAGDEAMMVKLADRIANVSSGGKRGMYEREMASFRQALYHRDHWKSYPLWVELEDLFR